METLGKVANWFPLTEYTFIRVFGSFKTPHAMPQFVTDKMLLQEFFYQMTSSFSKVLTKGKKKPWPKLPLTIDAYTVKDFREVEAEAEEMRGFHLGPLDHRTYDQERIVPDHCKRAKFKWSYQHTECPYEDEKRNRYNADRELAPGAWSDQEDLDDHTLEERICKLGGASSSQAKKPRTSMGHNTTTQQKQKEEKTQWETGKKAKEDEEKHKKNLKAEQKKKQEEEARKRKEEQEAEAEAEWKLKKELDQVKA